MIVWLKRNSIYNFLIYKVHKGLDLVSTQILF